MKIIYHKKELIEVQKALTNQGKTIGFVPTMGALHQGHLELIKCSKQENEVTFCSIFVNPTQFNNPDDLKKYPRTLDADCKLLATVGCDYVFAPAAEEMYDELPVLFFDFGHIEKIMEGKFRPGHFSGVGIVVSKLFHLVSPQKAYFGMKDLQQVAVIKRLVKDLNFDLQIIPCETVRETDGLAMSSRNRRLSEKGRKLAPQVYASLQLAKEVLSKTLNVQLTKETVNKHFELFPDFKLEYVEIIDFESFKIIETYDPQRITAICTANFLEGVRLIDNIVF